MFTWETTKCFNLNRVWLRHCPQNSSTLHSLCYVISFQTRLRSSSSSWIWWHVYVDKKLWLILCKFTNNLTSLTGLIQVRCCFIWNVTKEKDNVMGWTFFITFYMKQNDQQPFWHKLLVSNNSVLCLPIKESIPSLSHINCFLFSPLCHALKFSSKTLPRPHWFQWSYT